MSGVLVKETDEIRGWAGHAFKGFVYEKVCVCVSKHACVRMPWSMCGDQKT